MFVVTPERWASFFDILTEAETRANQESINAGIFSADEFDFTQFKGAEPYTLNFERLLRFTGRPELSSGFALVMFLKKYSVLFPMVNT